MLAHREGDWHALNLITSHQLPSLTHGERDSSDPLNIPL